MTRDFSRIVSEGTLRPKDVVPDIIDAYLDVAQTLFDDDQRQGTYEFRVKEAIGWHNEITQLVRYSALNQSNVAQRIADEGWSYLWETAAEALNSILPEGWYFGASDGDGALFGIWAMDEEGVQ